MMDKTDDWYRQAAEFEKGQDIGVGGLFCKFMEMRDHSAITTRDQLAPIIGKSYNIVPGFSIQVTDVYKDVVNYRMFFRSQQLGGVQYVKIKMPGKN